MLYVMFLSYNSEYEY